MGGGGHGGDTVYQWYSLCCVCSLGVGMYSKGHIIYKCRVGIIDRYICNNKQLYVGSVGVVNGQPLPSTQYTRAAPALPGGGGVDVGNVGMKDSAVLVGHLNSQNHVRVVNFFSVGPW